MSHSSENDGAVATVPDTSTGTSTTAPLNDEGSAAPERPTSRTRLSLRSMEHVVLQAIERVPGTVAVEGALKKLGGNNYPRTSVQMDPDSLRVSIDTAIAVVWPSPVTAVAEKVRESVAAEVQEYTGYEATRVNVVVGATVPGPRVTRAALEAYAVPGSTPIHVRSSSESLREITVGRTPVSIDVPPTKNVRSIEVPQSRSVTSVEVPTGTRSQAPLRDIRTATPVSVRSVDIPQAPKVRSIETPKPAEVRSVSAPRPTPLRAIEVADSVKVRSVKVPEALPARSVEAPKPVRPRSVSAPRPQPLRAISQRPRMQQRSVSTPTPVQVQRVSVPKAPKLIKPRAHSTRVRSVSAPKPLRLAKPKVYSTQVQSVRVPRPQPLRQIDIVPTPLGSTSSPRKENQR